MGGAYEHAAEHGSKPPYELPDSWINSKPKINLKTVYDTVSTSDIIGGNSGSPVINKAGEVVGIIFDGNIESLAWNFAYTDKVARAVEVDSRSDHRVAEEYLPRRWIVAGVGRGDDGAAAFEDADGEASREVK